MCKIAILEDYSLFCSGIKPVLEQIENYTVVAECRHVSEFLPQIKTLDPDVLVIDVLHCKSDELAALKKIRRKSSGLPVLLVVSASHSHNFEEYISMGVNGLVLNTSGTKELITAIQTLANGEDYFPPKVWVLLKQFLRQRKKDILPGQTNDKILTTRELSILKLFCKGYTYKEIGNALNISPRTVETHKKNISTKINVRSTAEMVEFAIQNNLN